ncbi:MAG: glycosyltransferase [Verrucomicrobia bacterium]|nr:glycosyltransferase [Verrucomicrobiota bacterium]
MLLTASNLFPRVGRPHWGIFNLQLFDALNRIGDVRNIGIVPDWKIWRWGDVRTWSCPVECSFSTRYEPVFYLPFLGRTVAADLYRLSLSGVRDEIREADAVYATWLYPDGVAMTELAAASGRPAWIMVQGSDTFHLDNPSRARTIRKACDKAEGLVCVASTLADRLHAAGVPKEKLHVVPNGVDTGTFAYTDRTEARDRLRGMADSTVGKSVDSSVVILFVGNLVRIKGVDLLMESCSLLDSELGGDWSLVIIGEGGDRPMLESHVRSVGLDAHVHFMDSRPHAEIATWMAAADCLALPSRSEGMPNVLLEAMAVGCPVVATDVGACRESTSGYAASRIVPSDDSGLLGRAIADVVRADYDRQELAQRQAGRYSWDRQARTIWDLIYGQ